MRRNKSIIPYLIFGLVGLFMMLDLGFMYLAKVSYTGVYTDNHYKKGLNFNQIYKSEVYHDKTGWKSDVVYENGLIIFKLFDSNGDVLSNAKVVAKVIRPVTDKYDINLELFEENGQYHGKVELPLKGQWEIRIKALKNGHEYVTSQRIKL